MTVCENTKKLILYIIIAIVIVFIIYICGSIHYNSGSLGKSLQKQTSPMRLYEKCCGTCNNKQENFLTFRNPSYSQKLQGVGNFLLGNMKGLHYGTDYVSPRRGCMRFFGPNGNYQGHNVTFHDDLREHDLRKIFNMAIDQTYRVKGVPTYNKQYCNPRLAEAFKYCQLDGSCINNIMTENGCFFGYM